MDKVDEGTRGTSTGCVQAMAILFMLLWLGVAPVGGTLLVESILGEMVAPGIVSAIAIIVSGLALWLRVNPWCCSLLEPLSSPRGWCS